MQSEVSMFLFSNVHWVPSILRPALRNLGGWDFEDLGVCGGWRFESRTYAAWELGSGLCIALLFGWPCLLTNGIFSVFSVFRLVCLFASNDYVCVAVCTVSRISLPTLLPQHLAMATKGKLHKGKDRKGGGCRQGGKNAKLAPSAEEMQTSGTAKHLVLKTPLLDIPHLQYHCMLLEKRL